ncbi:MAG: hypothetical protein DHS80DRAFT_33804 [Piptocephalis tieghemiana]|nr:MAG: hypothetical protein DHS80DRAFT_33804 [Piptocephalis tieghemiana]
MSINNRRSSLRQTRPHTRSSKSTEDTFSPVARQEFPKPQTLKADLLVDCVVIDNTKFQPKEDLINRTGHTLKEDKVVKQGHSPLFKSPKTRDRKKKKRTWSWEGSSRDRQQYDPSDTEEEEEEIIRVDEMGYSSDEDERYTHRLRKQQRPNYRIKPIKGLKTKDVARRERTQDEDTADFYQTGSSDSYMETDEQDSEEEAKREREERLEQWKLHRARRRAATWSEEDLAPAREDKRRERRDQRRHSKNRDHPSTSSHHVNRSKQHRSSILAQLGDSSSEEEGEEEEKAFVREREKETLDPVEREKDDQSEDELSYLNKHDVLKQRTRKKSAMPFLDRRRRAQHRAALRGKGVEVSSTNSDSEDEDQLSSSHESREESGSSVNEDDFIVEEDLTDSASQMNHLEVQYMIPNQFQMVSTLPIESCLRIIIEAYVIEILKPGFLKKIDRENISTYKTAIDIIDRRLDGTRDSAIASMGWTSEFKTALDKSPYLDVKYDLYKDDIVCDACQTTKYHITMSLTVCIDPVHPRYFNHLTGTGAGKYIVFHTGKVCGNRAYIYHTFRHYRYLLFCDVRDRVEEFQQSKDGQRYQNNSNKIMAHLRKKQLILRWVNHLYYILEQVSRYSEDRLDLSI